MEERAERTNEWWQALENRVRVLEDMEEIKKLHQNYVYWLCNLQWEDMLDCFVEEAEADILGDRLVGKAAIGEFFHQVLARRVKRSDGHLVAQPVITVEGDRAEGYWILYLFFSEPEVRWLQGRQECEYVKVGGKWKIRRMKFIGPWPPPEA
ncbi:MAG: nuclear transport factor 2 family protein [Clostridia bacterium]|jgi:hypothetical protein|nr:nuclear transport factor 2 family protein [Clostridia bacterium]MDH7574029.1 nuclear transport factor 2 family protein [Clostridia bacterium]